MILDLYILRRFTLWLAISVIALWLIAIVVDLIESIDIFIDHEALIHQILYYYIFRSPYWIILTLPTASMLAALFSLTGLSRRGEITAMKAAGISLQRILFPVFGFSLVLSGIGVLFTEFVVPEATYQYNSTRDNIRSYSRSDGSRRQVLLQDINGQLIYARSYDHTRQQAHSVLWEHRPHGVIRERATAKQLEWRDRRWTMVNGNRYLLVNDQLQATTFDTLTLSSLNLTPVDFARQQKKPEEMNFSELQSYINRAIANGEDATRHIVDLHFKISFPLTCFAIVLIIAPIAANAQSSNRATSFGIGVIVCFLLYSSVKAGQALGWNAIISPWQGAWLPNMIFVTSALIIIRKAHS